MPHSQLTVSIKKEEMQWRIGWEGCLVLSNLHSLFFLAPSLSLSFPDKLGIKPCASYHRIIQSVLPAC
jgi:hypothetical protein